MNTFNSPDFNILIVDDLPKNIQVLGNVLKTQKYSIEFATSGKNALKWISKKDFDIILLDVMMPEMDGFDTCKHIRNNDAYRDTPIIFLTAKTDKNSIVKGFELGGQDYITKPFDANELLARVKTQLELKESKEKLKSVNTWLEKKVEERTVELKKLNAQLEESNDKLNKLNKELIDLDTEKTEFLKIISHEIRTPLNGLMGMLDIIKSDIKDEELSKLFDYIDISSYRLEKFALQALLITELRTKTRKINKTENNIKSIVENSLNTQFKKSITKKNLDIQLKFTPEDILIMADPELFGKCMENVIENAIQFCKAEGQIIIQASGSNGSVCIEVFDEGLGFSEKALDNLFKFFTPGLEHIDKNIGLDLALVNLIMKAHNGKIEVNNRDKGGAVVRLYFPL